MNLFPLRRFPACLGAIASLGTLSACAGHSSEPQPSRANESAAGARSAATAQASAPDLGGTKANGTTTVGKTLAAGGGTNVQVIGTAGAYTASAGDTQTSGGATAVHVVGTAGAYTTSAGDTQTSGGATNVHVVGTAGTYTTNAGGTQISGGATNVHVVGAAGTSTASRSGGSAPLEPKLLAGTAFELTDQNSTCQQVLKGTTSLHITAATETALTGLVFDSGHASGFEFTREPAASTWTAKREVLIFQDYETSTSDGHRFWLEGATLAIANSPDGAPMLTITGKVGCEVDANDFHTTELSATTVVGSPLTRAPTFLRGSCPASPLDSFTASLSVPLEGSASAKLIPSAGPSIALTPERYNDAIIGISSNVVLPLGISFQLVASGHALGSTTAPIPVDCSAFASKALFPSDGFESSSEAGSEVSSHGVPAIHGKRSWTGGMLRLARPAGTTKLMFDVRRIEPSTSLPGTFSVHAGVVGAPPIVREIELGQKPETFGDMQVSAVQHIEVQLTGDGNEVLFETRTSQNGGTRFYIKAVYPWIDDVRLE